MASELFANNFAARLASGCAPGDTTLVLDQTLPAALQSGAGQSRWLISDSFGSEYVIIPGQAGPTVTGVTRGAEGTTATSHSQGTFVSHLLTAGAIGGVTTIVPSGDGTGATDTANIQAAINAAQTGVYPYQGGIVTLAPGIFHLNAPIAITADNIVFQGSGCGNPYGNANTNGNPQKGGTILTPTASFSGSNVIAVGQSGTPSRTLAGNQVRNLAIDGNNLPGSQGGIFWQVAEGVIKDVFVSKCPGDNVILDGNSSPTFPNGAYDNHITNVRSNEAGGRGLVFQNSATDNMCSGIVVLYAGNATTGTSDGVYIDSTCPSNRFDSTCYVYSCGGNGFNIQTAMETKLIGVRIEDVNGGIYVNAGSNGHGGTVIVGCTLRNCSAATDNTTDAIQLTASTNVGACLIADNHFQTDQGNTNGVISGSQYNRPRYLINIATANFSGTVIGDWSAGSTGTGYSGGAGYAGTQAINDQTAVIYTGSVGQTGLPEMRSGNWRLTARSNDPNGNMTAGIGSQVGNTGGGHGTAAYLKESGSGNTGWVPLGSRMLRKGAVTVSPSATANTNGATQTVSPSTDYFSFSAQAVRLVSGGTFGSETLTVNVTFNFSDSTSQTFSATFTAAGTTTDMTNGNLLVNAFKDGVFLTSVGVNCQSTISSSAATATVTVAAVNG